MFSYKLVEKKISIYEENKIDIGINGHIIFDAKKYQHLKNGIYRILSQNFYYNDNQAFVDFTFNKGIINFFNLTFISYVGGEIIVDKEKQVIVISAHSSTFHGKLLVRLYRVE